jgi:hypothetical protein
MIPGDIASVVVGLCDIDSRIILYQAGIKDAIRRIKGTTSTTKPKNVTHFDSCVDLGIPGTTKHYVLIKELPAILLVNMNEGGPPLSEAAFAKAGWIISWGC